MESALEAKILMFLRLNYSRKIHVLLMSLVVVGWEPVFRRLDLV